MEPVSAKQNQDQLSPETEYIIRRLFWQLVERANLQKRELNLFRLKSLKNLLKNNKNLIESLIKEIFKSLHRDNSEIRFGAVLVVAEIFPKSHMFRELLIDDFQDFLLLSAETDALRWPMPDPKDVGKALKIFTMKLVQKWHETYGKAYRKLDLAFNYLKQCKTLDFQQLEAETLAERQRAEIEESRKQVIRERICRKIETELTEWEPDCDRCLTEMDNAFELIYPVFIQDCSATDSGLSVQRSSRAHGLHDFQSYSGSICLNLRKPIVELSEDNQALVQSLQDNHKLLNNCFSPKAAKCLQSVTKIGGCDGLVKKLIDLKQKIDIASKKFIELNLCRTTKITEQNNSTEVDSDFEEVPEKEGLELGVPVENFEDSLPQYILDHTKQIDAQERGESESDPSRPGTSKDGGKSAPVLPFGLDLKYWETEKIEAPLIVRNSCDSHRFWRAPVEEEPGQDSGYQESATEAVRSRVIEFVGNFQPVERLCRAPVKDGTLCNRKDRYKCPFHGAIVDRDNEGRPLKISATAPRFVEETLSTSSSMPWRDLELLEDIEANSGQKVGADARRDEKKKKGGKKEKRCLPASRLTRKRLETKLLDKRAMKRIGGTLDAMQKARNQRKHGHQFNYSLNA